MDNLSKPASPTIVFDDVQAYSEDRGYADHHSLENNAGFTKLEKGALMIAAGLVSKYNLQDSSDQAIIAQLSVELAAEVINQANK